MALQGATPFDDASPSSAPGPELGGALPVRVRPARPNGPREAEAAPSEPFAGCPLFPVDSTDARGVTYRDKFAACGFTQDDADSGDLGLRIRLESPDGRAGGTSKATFQIPLLPLSTTQEAIHDRWGPGKYEVTLCRRSGNDRIKSGAKSISRNVTLVPRNAPEFGPEGELDVGDEAWPIDPDDGSFTAAMRAEMDRREEIREELAAQSAQDRGAYRDDPRARPDRDPYAGAPQHAAPSVGLGLDPRAYPPGTTFAFDAQGRMVPVAPKTSPLDGLLAQFSRDPVEAAKGLAVAFGAIKTVLAPSTPTAQDIAAATAAAVAQAMGPALQTIAQAVTQKPTGPDPMEVFKAQLLAEREAADRRAAEAREAAARADAERERRESEARVRAAQEVAERERKWELQIERLRADGRAREIEAQLAAAKNAGEAEKTSLLRELAEVRKRLTAGEAEAAPGFLEQMGDVLDTKFGEVLAPIVGPSIARAIDVFASPPAAMPAPPQQVAPVFTPPPAAMPAPQYPAPSAAPDESAPFADDSPEEDA